MGIFEAEICDLVQCIGVVVRPDPGALVRVIEPFAKLGLVPLSVNSRLFPEADELAIDIQIAGMGDEQGRRIARQIESFPITLKVMTGRKYLVRPPCRSGPGQVISVPPIALRRGNAMTDRPAARLIISGRVQGVGYRYWTVGEARRLGLDGWVRNLADGGVEILALGDPVAIDRLEAACRSGPAASRVTAVARSLAADDGSQGFYQKPTE